MATQSLQLVAQLCLGDRVAHGVPRRCAGAAAGSGRGRASGGSPEPFGLAVIEALLAGRAVIATNHGGPAEIITDGVTDCSSRQETRPRSP